MNGYTLQIGNGGSIILLFMYSNSNVLSPEIPAQKEKLLIVNLRPNIYSLK